jgi:hypothetical protein
MTLSNSHLPVVVAVDVLIMKVKLSVFRHRTEQAALDNIAARIYSIVCLPFSPYRFNQHCFDKRQYQKMQGAKPFGDKKTHDWGGKPPGQPHEKIYSRRSLHKQYRCMA